MNNPLIFAHRGAKQLAPENTMRAFRLAHELGAKALELDVQLSSDHQVKIFHDDVLDRTSNGHGFITEQPDNYLKKLDAGKWFSEKFKGEKIPSLAEALAEFKHWDMLINIEIKPDNKKADILVDEVVHLLKTESFPKEKILISSFMPEVIQRLKNTAPEFKRAFNVHDQQPTHFSFAHDMGCFSIHPAVELLKHQPEKWIATAHQANLKVHPFVINDQTLAKTLLSAGIDGFFTDSAKFYI